MSEFVKTRIPIPEKRCRSSPDTVDLPILSFPIIKVKAVTTRTNPIMQTCIGPGEEHVSMAGIPTEASILAMVEKAMPGKCLNVYNPSFGGGKYVTIMQLQNVSRYRKWI